MYEFVLFSFSAHENNFHCLAKAIDRISVALCSNNGDNMEVRLREFLVVSENTRSKLASVGNAVKRTQNI